MSKTLFIVLISFAVSIPASAQFTEYIVRLKDKNGTIYSINRPQEFLSQRAIDRRQRQNIPITEQDIPVVAAYLDSIQNAGSVIIKNTSKWLNQVLIQTTDMNALQKINSFSFVMNTSPIKRKGLTTVDKRKEIIHEFKETTTSLNMKDVKGLNYGYSGPQIKIHNGDFLHDKGFTGKGMLIAVIDDGFYHYKTLPAFDSLRLQNRILDLHDFVSNLPDLNDEDPHGMYCLSLISANVPGTMVGTAPNASFLLYRSENVSSESPSEEQNWVAAAERSDSAGADVITTSLGYNLFDNPIFNHTYQDMNGETTIAARGAGIAASKGMILLIAAGNEGNNSWHYITTPGDAKGVLTVGAVDINGTPASFSSYGPSSDGRVKPDVASVGVNDVVQGASGGFVQGSGTSFATPNLAGLVACLWQAFPDFSSSDIMEFVRKSSPTYNSPTAQMGYGIPDFEQAFDMLSKERVRRNAAKILGDNTVAVYPNPVTTVAHVLINPASSGSTVVRLIDMSGRICFRKNISLTAGEIYILDITKNSLPRGIYVIQLSDGTIIHQKKIVIQ